MIRKDELRRSSRHWIVSGTQIETQDLAKWLLSVTLITKVFLHLWWLASHLRWHTLFWSVIEDYLSLLMTGIAYGLSSMCWQILPWLHYVSVKVHSGLHKSPGTKDEGGALNFEFIRDCDNARVDKLSLTMTIVADRTGIMLYVFSPQRMTMDSWSRITMKRWTSFIGQLDQSHTLASNPPQLYLA
jgi:hypothetical protein